MKAVQIPTRYTFSRDSDGCDDVFDIRDTQTDRVISSVHFWDCVEGEEAEAEEEARQLVRDLNLNGPRVARAFDDVA